MLNSIWYPPLAPYDEAENLYRSTFGGDYIHDQLGWHIVLTIDGAPAAAGRLDYVKADHGRISQVCVEPEYRGRRLADAVIRLLIYKAGELNITEISASADSTSSRLLTAIGFKALGNNEYTMEVCDGCCENCKDKRACQEE